MWNLQNKINEENGNRLIGTESRLVVARGEGVMGQGDKGEGMEKHRLAVTEQPCRCEVQRRE